MAQVPLKMAPPKKHKGKWDPKTWAGFVPNGIGQVKPNHYVDMIKIMWANRDNLPYAWRILSRGVCDGCALGTTGLKDWTMEGPHLCMVRLNLLRLNTIGALDSNLLGDVASLKKLKSKELRDLGRIPYPMVRRKGDAGFKRISWNDALDEIAGKVRALPDPNRFALFLTARGVTNEVYYVAQKVTRFLGTNNIDNAARICHSPSTFALKDALGISSSSCSYSDWIGTDVLVLIGSDVPNNQPVTTKYMYYAKKEGTKIIVVNPYREPGLERYWVPSAMESAIFGTKLADEFFGVHTGGDMAFFTGCLKALVDLGMVDRDFVDTHADGFDELAAQATAQEWADLERNSGSTRADMEKFASIIGNAKSGVFVWSMGVTQHRYGVDNVRSLVNLALARGFIGRQYCGVMPIRGHSGVQGGAEMGAYATAFPNSTTITPQSAEKFGKLWGFTPPGEPGLTTPEMLTGAHEGKIDILYSAGGNFMETMPDPDYVAECLTAAPMRVHQDIVLTSQMLVDPGETVIILPATTRYEQRGGGTETTTERRVAYSPEIPGRRIGEARSEWEIFVDLAERVHPDRKSLIHYDNSTEIRQEIALANPNYDGIQHLHKQGDAMQWGGTRLCDNYKFLTADGRAHFVLPDLSVYDQKVPEGKFRVSTRRGKQFNSMVQSKRDSLTGAMREAVFMSKADADELGLANGDPVLLRSPVGEYQGNVFLAPMRPRNLQVHWPEGNILLAKGVTDPLAKVPDYNALVDVIPVRDSSGK